MAIVGVDLDGVVFRFTKAFVDHVKKCKPEILSGDPEEEAPAWDWFTKWPMTREQFLAEMTCAVDSMELFWTAELYENDIAWQIQRLQEAGHFVHIVTHRFSGSAPKAAEVATHWALNRNGIRFDDITFAQDKTSVKTDYFLEDNVDNYLALQEAGTLAFLINRPYNQSRPGAWRVDTFAQFVDEVLRIEEYADSFREELS